MSMGKGNIWAMGMGKARFQEEGDWGVVREMARSRVGEEWAMGNGGEGEVDKKWEIRATIKGGKVTEGRERGKGELGDGQERARRGGMRGRSLSRSGQRPELVGAAVLVMVAAAAVAAAWTVVARRRVAVAGTVAAAKMAKQA